jgi:Baseplate J-like protein
MAAQYRCASERRRSAVRDATPVTVNGIDFLEVRPSQTELDVTFIHAASVDGLTRENVVIDGGVRITNIHVTDVVPAGQALTVTVNAPGDFSTYTLRLRRSETNDAPPEGFDPQLAEVSFSFKANCDSDFDCKPMHVCPPELHPEPEIDYLAKDFASFRRLMLDRLAALVPDWTERSPADGLVALVELLAYVGDHLSYFQDSVATEAYLGTARKRVSVRRHARLLDYFVHSGCNARAWVCLEVADASSWDARELPAGTRLLSRGARPDAMVAPDDLDRALAERPAPVVFETAHPVTLRHEHQAIPFYTWSDDECCLPRGATRATLLGTPTLSLVGGDVLLLEEVVSPTTGAEADADRSHRHVVRLTSVEAGVDPLDATAVVEIEWGNEDALPFPLCVSALVADESGTKTLIATAVAHGNVVLADHGRSLQAAPLVPDEVPAEGAYRPRLGLGPVTFGSPLDLLGSATAALACDPHLALPKIQLAGEDTDWQAARDLLGSDRFEPELVVETESDGSAVLRFGDGEHGRKPQPGAHFTADYRIGNGLAGNVGAGTIARVVLPDSGIERVRNPLAATGGADPEPLDRVRQAAPEAFRTQERAVTEADYAEIAERHAEVQRASAGFRWTGSWYTTFVTVDRSGGRALDPDFARRLRAFLDRYRMAGHDLELERPIDVPLELELEVCVSPGYFRSEVKQRLLDELSSRVLPDGRRGFFHPDNFTFGQRVYLSQIYEAAMRVGGVSWVRASRFHRFGRAAGQELELERLEPGRTEVARLDNDPNFPENGRLELVMKDGM